MIIENPAKGIYIYKNALPESMEIPQKIENVLGDGKSVFFKWSEALVGDYKKIKDYRDCVDFKVRRDALKPGDPKADAIALIHDQITEKLNECLDHYVNIFGMNKLEYMEAINFVKYGPGQHFQVHPDSGPTYSCNVSTVMYLNSDYEGGELWFPNFEYTYKPEYGDIVLFPSSFLYAHAALPVKSGTKYSAVTMFDYNDRNHKDHVNASGNLQGRSRFL